VLLHHLVAAVLDNSMDEALWQARNRIEVELARRLFLTVRDNGAQASRLIHTRKFTPIKSAWSESLCTLHAAAISRQTWPTRPRAVCTAWARLGQRFVPIRWW